MWTLLEYTKRGNGYVKVALVAIIVSIGSAWAMDRSDETQRDRELDGLKEQLQEVRKDTKKMGQSLARIEAALDALINRQEREEARQQEFRERQE